MKDTNIDPRIYDGNLEQLSTAKTLVKAIMPLTSSNQGQIEKVARSLARDMPSTDLQELENCLSFCRGLLYVASVKAKAIDEYRVLEEFAVGQGWQKLM